MKLNVTFKEKNMLKILLTSTVLFLSSCMATQDNISEINNKKMNCPTGVECFVEVLDNTTMDLKEDTIGQLYVRMNDKEGNTVVKHIYRFTGRPEIADDGYEEVVYFEIKNSVKNLNVSDDDLARHNLIVQKSCFCRDAGYELITSGKLDLKQTKYGYDVSIAYKSEKTLKLYELDFFVEN